MPFWKKVGDGGWWTWMPGFFETSFTVGPGRASNIHGSALLKQHQRRRRQSKNDQFIRIRREASTKNAKTLMLRIRTLVLQKPHTFRQVVCCMSLRTSYLGFSASDVSKGEKSSWLMRDPSASVRDGFSAKDVKASTLLEQTIRLFRNCF